MARPLDGAPGSATQKMPLAEPVEGGEDEEEVPDASDERRGGGEERGAISPYHPFFGWEVGDVLRGLRCARATVRDGVPHLELTNRPLLPPSPPPPTAAVADASDASPGRDAEMPRSGAGGGSMSSPPAGGGDGGADDVPVAFAEDPSELPPGAVVTAVITRVCPGNRGVWAQVCPGVGGFAPALELSADEDVLNRLGGYCRVGGRIDLAVVGGGGDAPGETGGDRRQRLPLRLSALSLREAAGGRKGRRGRRRSGSSGKELGIPARPGRGDLAVGRINRSVPPVGAPALMLELRGGRLGRCDVTELDDVDDWVNMPLGQARYRPAEKGRDGPGREGERSGKHQSAVVTDEELAEGRRNGNEDAMDMKGGGGASNHCASDDEATEEYPHGRYVKCRILSTPANKSRYSVDVSLRPSRLRGNLEDDPIPKPRDMVRAYIVSTNRKGCFVRLSRSVDGRVMLKELSDGFLPDPAASFPPGRLVVGRVKAVRGVESDGGGRKKPGAKVLVDLDMRESTLLEDRDRVLFQDIKEGNKYRGTVTRVESYGVFVRLENSELSGLAHLSECSDKYIKSLGRLYDPGDLVKVLVIKVDAERKRIALSLKASHFNDDSESDESSSSGDSSSSDSDDDANEAMEDVVVSEGSNDDGNGDIDSEDENYAAKLAVKLQASKEELNSDKDNSDEEGHGGDSSNGDSSKSDASEDDEDDKGAKVMDTDVGFDWGTRPSAPNSKGDTSESDESESSDDESEEDKEINNTGKSSHRARKKAAAKRREEKEILLRESALADGTADQNPETAADFERLLAGDPNSSEHWIRYMAYHLSLADIDSARNVASRAFERIEFRREVEKLNVWTALLTLELKYGTPKSLGQTMERACQHNNPKQVYLRVSEMLEREVDTVSTDQGKGQVYDAALARADEMFAKMCKKFKSKKTVWIANLKYLLKGSRHEEAHSLLKRSLTSLPDYKHVETMSKFAQLEYEYGSIERGRTIFDTLVANNPKRMDILFVYIDKEVKHGEVEAARAIFEDVVNPADEEKKLKCSDKQMKSLFKKWYRIEEEHGDHHSREHVKSAAKAFVERITSVK